MISAVKCPIGTYNMGANMQVGCINFTSLYLCCSNFVLFCFLAQILHEHVAADYLKVAMPAVLVVIATMLWKFYIMLALIDAVPQMLFFFSGVRQMSSRYERPSGSCYASRAC